MKANETGLVGGGFSGSVRGCAQLCRQVAMAMQDADDFDPIRSLGMEDDVVNQRVLRDRKADAARVRYGGESGRQGIRISRLRMAFHPLGLRKTAAGD